MSIAAIKAYFDCDGCGTQFGVELDPASKAWERGQSLDSMAEDAIRGGSTLAGDSCSLQADLHLCPKCTRTADGINPEDDGYQPTRDEILRAVGAL
jgi:hypothetical protein